ncbi:hypothetical protein HF078_10945 [Bacillus sp. RO2]|uniref:hypothetical protein n=1 Tax=Bacillus sp. RO2 TaxID=2723913 RepID=UPI00145CAC9D|nr:hypothetical protein [Bacillus sp. RO2]NMH73594.1 hypothetical protein [Bacillus sp. RO2]
MKFRVLACLILPIPNIAFGVTFNLIDSFKGSPATMENLIVSLVHLAVWIICFGMAFKAKNKAVLKLYAIFLALTSAMAALTAYINYVDTTVNFAWAIPFAMLLLPQWYGFNYFIESYFVSSIILLFISLVLFSTTVWSWRKII